MRPPLPCVVDRQINCCCDGDMHLRKTGLARPSAASKHVDHVCVRRHADQAIANRTGARRAQLAAGRHVDRRRRCRQRHQPQVLDRPVLASVVHDVAGTELTDDLDCFFELRSPLTGSRPSLAERLLVQPLTRPDAEEEAVLQHHRSRTSGLSDGDRGRAVHHGAHPCADLQLFRGIGDRADHRPHVPGVSLVTNPRLEMVADHRCLEAGSLSHRRLPNEISRIVLFTRQPPAESERSIRHEHRLERPNRSAHRLPWSHRRDPAHRHRVDVAPLRL